MKLNNSQLMRLGNRVKQPIFNAYTNGKIIAYYINDGLFREETIEDKRLVKYILKGVKQ